MRVLFRVDASQKIGTGHLIRCLTLAQALRDRGIESLFLTRYKSPALEILETARFQYRLFSIQSEPQGENWLGVSEDDDAKTTIDVIRSISEPVWGIVVDHYAIGHEWEQMIKPHIPWILAIDDLANRKHDCDILLDQNFYGEDKRKTRYAALTDSKTQVLLGPRYSLLRKEFKKLHNHEPKEGAIHQILVFYGGSDLTGETEKILDIVSEKITQHIKFKVVLGKANVTCKELQSRFKTYGNVEVFINTSQMAQLIQESDLALCAGGTFSWERACLGLPAIVTAVAANQIEVSSELAEFGAQIYLGTHDQVTSAAILDKIKILIESPQRMSSMSQKLLQLVDGEGADRVIDIMLKERKSDF